MREIKFRAWDERNKIMHNDFQFIKSGDTENDWIIFKSDKHECFDRWVNNPYFSHQMKIMQYTGLKDKNGNCIYEGDIIQKITDWNKDVKYLYEVVYSIDGFKQKDSFGDIDIWYDWDEGLEVIGNIYENGDLLK